LFPKFAWSGLQHEANFGNGALVNTTLRDFSGTLVLVGAGKMGAAMLEGWFGRGLDARRVVVLEPQPSPQIASLRERGLRINPSQDGVRADVLVVAVKPQSAQELMPQIAALVGPSSLVVSIMAGRTLAFLQGALPVGTAVVRSMPNTPAAIGRGITVAVPSTAVTAAQRQITSDLLAAIGAVEWVEDEALMDAVTAVSGSGPAYVFLLVESLARAGTAAGLPADLSDRLARATVAGAGELLHRASDEAATLRKNVTSPGGTTAAALDVLMAQNGLDPLMERAIAAATKRSKDLGS
jgi:pyrroline-5-carboxylate reductase